MAWASAPPSKPFQLVRITPTSSYAESIGTTKARELGFKTIACASTGTAASSQAGFCADAGLPSVIFVPARAPAAKVAQLRAFGARVLLVEGSYDEAYTLCEEACRAFGWYDRNCAVNPYLVEGKKTCGREIGEQFRDAPPDGVAVALGDGCVTSGIWKGLKEMHALGVLSKLPRMLAVQAAGAAPLVHAWEARNYGDGPVGQSYVKVKAETVADSIAVGEPRNWRKALRAVKASDGSIVAVTDDAILDAAKDIAAAVAKFEGVRRRQEVRGEVRGVTIIDDFGHHPTAMRETLQGLRHRYPHRRIWALFEPRSNTTRRAVFQKDLPAALALADGVFVAQVAALEQIPEHERLHPEQVVADIKAAGKLAFYEPDAAAIVARLDPLLQPGDVVIVFSNGGFGGIHQKLLELGKSGKV